MTQPIREAAQDRTYQALCAWLTRAGVAYRTLHHAPTLTSEDSARARGEAVRIGGKALLLKVGEDFRLWLLLDSRVVEFEDRVH